MEKWDEGRLIKDLHEWMDKQENFEIREQSEKDLLENPEKGLTLLILRMLSMLADDIEFLTETTLKLVGKRHKLEVALGEALKEKST